MAEYWKEAQSYNVFIMALTSLGYFQPPDGYAKRMGARVIYVLSLVMMSIGIGVMNTCYSNNSMPLAMFMSLVFITIPLEVYKFFWFGVLVSKKEVQDAMQDASMCEQCKAGGRRVVGLVFGSITSCACFFGGMVYFIMALTNTYPYCDRAEVNIVIRDILLIQMLLVDTFMVLPYWREQGKWLSFIGPLGPIVGLSMHFWKYGNFLPAPDSDLKVTEDVKGSETNPMASNLQEA